MRSLNLIGQKFGRLTVTRDTGLRRARNVVWAVQCSCGGQAFVTSHNLISGEVRSCGCLRKELLSRIPQKGEDNPYSKLTEDDVISIRQNYATAEWSQKELAAVFNVHPSCISKVVLGTRWNHI